MERHDDIINGHQQTGQGGAGVWSPSSSAPSAAGVAAAFSEIEALGKNVPVFLDRTFKMIGQVPDDIICWSRAGDSFIIKQVLLFEEVLPSFYNHKKFTSFVRQLNFYGFRKMKGRTSPRSRPADGAGATAAPKECESWEEYTHPLFRRGRPDLLVDIRRKKDGGRLKRKRAESHQSDILCTLATGVGTVSGDLKAVSKRLDNMMSLLEGMASGRNQAASTSPASRSDDANRHAPAPGAGGGSSSFAAAGGGSGFAVTALSSTASSPAAAARVGSGQWGVGGDGDSDAMRQRGQHPCARGGAPVGYCVVPSFPTEQWRQGWQGHALRSQPPQQPYPARLYSALPNIRHLYTAPDDATSTTTTTTPAAAAAAAAAARALGSAPTGAPHQQQPPPHLPRPWFANIPSSEHNEGGRDKN